MVISDACLLFQYEAERNSRKEISLFVAAADIKSFNNALGVAGVKSRNAGARGRSAEIDAVRNDETDFPPFRANRDHRFFNLQFL
jgi:hypothetical protein